MSGKLSVARIRSLKKPGRYADGGTLYLNIAPAGSRQWIQRLTIDGRRHDIGLGGFPLVSLAEARELAFDNRRFARRGGDPLAAKRTAAAPTFREAAKRKFDALTPTWRSKKTGANWWAHLERYAFRIIGDLPVNRIEREEILRVLTPIWTKKPESARRVRRNIKATLEWCQAHGFVEQNMAGEAINGALPAQPAVKAHMRALPYRDASAALVTVDSSTASLTAKLALRFLVLTAARSGEVRGARWDEIEGNVWKIPGTRMKGGEEHRVPLSDAALDVVNQARALDDGSGLVFPSPVRRGCQLSDMTLTKVLRDTGLAKRATVHGFRTTFATWCADTGKPTDIADAALAHAVPGVRGSYFRSDLFDRRRRLMSQWAAFLAGADATVVQLHG